MALLRRTVLAVALIGAGVAAPSAHAAPVDFDSTFGTGGIVSGADTVLDDGVMDTVVLDDGRIVTVSGSGSPADIRVTRYESDGDPDPTFGDGDGIEIIDIAGSFDYAREILVLPISGKLLIAGNATISGESNFLVARLETDGDLDMTFGGVDGWATADVGYDGSYAFSLARQSDGKIVLGGRADGNPAAGTPDNDFAFARFSAAGVLDTTFGFGAGWSTQSLEPYPNEEAVQIWIDSLDRIVAAGKTQMGIDVFFTLARMSSTGFVDPTFGDDSGHTVVPPITNYADVPYDALRTSDGKYVIVGETQWDNGVRMDKDFAAARLDADGMMDSSFGGDGTVAVDFAGANEEAYAVDADECGRLVLAGATPGLSPGTFDVGVVRLDTAGTPDWTFGNNGRFTHNYADYDDPVQSVAWQPLDNKILLGGIAVINEFNFIRTRIARIEGGGVCDPGPAPVPPVPPVAPGTPIVTYSSTVSSPSYAKKLKRKSSLTIKGSATVAGATITKVEVALRRVVSRKCHWLKSTRGSFKKTKKSGDCAKTTWLKASGTSSWSLKVKKKLAKGSYQVYSRVHLSNGTVQSTFANRQNAGKFTLR